MDKLPESFLTEYDELLGRIAHGVSPELIDDLSALLVRAQEYYQPEKKNIRSFNHVLESYYYDFFINAENEEYEIAQINLGMLFRTLGDCFMAAERASDAIRIYEVALSYNPVDLDTYYSIIEYWKRQEDYAQVRELTDACFRFICTRMDLAKYYRNLAFVHMMEYRPELAEPLYEYSQLFYHSDQAEIDLQFLEKALKRKRKDYSIQELQRLLERQQIPTTANPQTVGLTLKVAEAELEAGHSREALDCYTLVYDMTLDSEVGDMIKKLKNS